MDLRKRLADLDRLTRKTQSAPLPSGGTGGRAPEALEGLGLRPLNDSPGSVWVKDDRETWPWPGGGLPDLEGFFTRAGEASPRLGEILFLDTETTGLAGGTGTLAFLVGVGWFADGVFHTRQYFLPDFAAEDSMLVALAELAADFRVVMTFNGASFDLPLLRTRALMNRRGDPCAALIGWDLLVPGRRIWGRSLDDCRQQTLERNLLDMGRTDMDIDGSLIPQIWFDFLKEPEGDMMARVLHHNQKDVVGMAGIFNKVVEACRRTPEDLVQVPWREAWSLGRIAEKRKDTPGAASWMLRATGQEGGAPPAALGQARFVADAVRILKRGAHWSRVRALLEGALRAGLDEPWVRREAAILHEHRLDNPELALHHARRCDEPRRVARLEAKLAALKENLS